MPMPAPAPHRRSLPFLSIVTFCAALAACGDGGGGGGTLPDESANTLTLQRVSADTMYGVAGARLPDAVTVRVVDAQGRPVSDTRVAFSVATGGGTLRAPEAWTDVDGFARAVWVLGDAGAQEMVANAGTGATIRTYARFASAPATVAPALARLGDLLDWSANNLQQTLPNNPLSAGYINAKIELLRTPGLGGAIVTGGRYAQGSFTSSAGRSIPITAVFPVEGMRGEAERTVALLESSVPLVEQFLGVPYPWETIHAGIGFIVGDVNMGWVNVEDRVSYDARTAGRNVQPYEAGVVHEATHVWMGHESLNQFLELYGYNRVKTGSPDPARWISTRDWVPGRETNVGVQALLDIYQLIGPDGMAAAYRAILPLHPAYGVTIPADVQAAFAATVPVSVRPQVAAKLAKVGF